MVYIIAYIPAKAERNDSLIMQIRSYPSWVMLGANLYLVDIPNKRPREIREDLTSYISEQDQLFVAELNGNAAWRLDDEAIGMWIKNHLNKTNNASNMKVEQLKQAILHAFEKHNCMANEIVPMRYWRFTFLPKLNPKEQELFAPAVNELIDEGKIIYEKEPLECLRLTEAGYEVLYED